MKRCFIITGGMGNCGGSGAVVRVRVRVRVRVSICVLVANVSKSGCSGTGIVKGTK
jgi:hypothetical protein